ncbi:putative purine nucleoside permease [Marasmius fiardii PR-910]|nr:putative purine nucleoside permease [Marasmius fiardii PR-910]
MWIVPSTVACLTFSALSLAANVTSGAPTPDNTPNVKIAPKVFIFSMFEDEGTAWFHIPEFNVLARNITVPGFSPLFPQAHCTADGSICQMITGEGEINAVASVASLIHSSTFDLTHTYFLIAGIAGGNPNIVTTGSVTFARFAVQVALQYEIDAREIPASFNTGYVGQGATAPGQYPPELYGTEVFEVNDALRRIAFNFSQKANLSDTKPARDYRANYKNSVQSPNFALCDTATADTYWAGVLLAQAFENTTTLWTNGTGKYCTTQQEDNATLEILMRGDISGLVDFSRVIIMRTISDFDRQFPGQSAAESLLLADQEGFDISITNIYRAGVQVVQGIVGGWDRQFRDGVKPDNYIGDILGSLGGRPDFGPGNIFRGGKAPSARRSLRRRFQF